MVYPIDVLGERTKLPTSKKCNGYAEPGSLGYWIRYEITDLILLPVQMGYGVVTVEICDPAQGIMVSSRVKVKFLAAQTGLPVKKISNLLTKGKVGGKHNFPKIESGSKALWNLWTGNGYGQKGMDIRKIRLKKLSILLPMNGTNMNRHFILVARDNKNKKIVYNNRKHLSRHWGWDIWNISLTFGRIAYKSDGAFSPIRVRKGSCSSNRYGGANLLRK